MDYQPIQIVYPGEDESDLRGPTGTQIVLYNEMKNVKPDVVFETLENKMHMNDGEDESNIKCSIYIIRFVLMFIILLFKMIEGDRTSEVNTNYMSESDEVCVFRIDVICLIYYYYQV